MHSQRRVHSRTGKERPCCGPAAGSHKLNLGIIGVANRSAENLAEVSSENIAALRDVDSNYLAAAAQKYPKATTHKEKPHRHAVGRGPAWKGIPGVERHTAPAPAARFLG